MPAGVGRNNTVSSLSVLILRNVFKASRLCCVTEAVALFWPIFIRRENMEAVKPALTVPLKRAPGRLQDSNKPYKSLMREIKENKTTAHPPVLPAASH